MKVAERNHYLPRFYLKAFLPATDPKSFWVYDKKGGTPRPQTPINTGIERHLYNLENPDGSVGDTLERQVFAPLDTAAKSVIDRLLRPRARLEESDLPKLAEFLSFMGTRVPRSIRAAQELGEALACFHVSNLAEKPEEIRKLLSELKGQGKLFGELTVEELQKAIEGIDQDFKLSLNEKVSMLTSLVGAREIHEELLRMNWCLCCAHSDAFFICSDSPLVCFVPRPDGTAIFGGGYALLEVEVTFPLSPAKCLYIDRKHNQRYRALNEDAVKEVNRRTAWAAERFIISTHKCSYVEELLNWSAGSIDKPRMNRNELFSLFRARARERREDKPTL